MVLEEKIHSHHATLLLRVNPQHEIRLLVRFKGRGHDDVISRWEFVTSAVFPRVDVLRRCRHRTVVRKELLSEIAALRFTSLKQKLYAIISGCVSLVLDTSYILWRISGPHP